MRKTLNLSDVVFNVFEELEYFYHYVSRDDLDTFCFSSASLRGLLYTYSAYAFRKTPNNIVALTDLYCNRIIERDYDDLYQLTSDYLNDLENLKGVR